MAGNISWCDPLSSQCWNNVNYHEDICTLASIPTSPELDDQGGYEGEDAKLKGIGRQAGRQAEICADLISVETSAFARLR